MSLIYCGITFLNSYRKYIFQKRYSANIIGVGNLILGGTGKTPFTISLAKKEKDVAIVLRGYGRDSKGLIVVSENGKILVDISKSGDEAMLYAQKLSESSVIVSEDRDLGIRKAQELGAKNIFLDDSYRQHQIRKDREYLIVSEIDNPFCIPAGGYREKLWFFKRDIISAKEGVDFWREVYIDSPTEIMVLVTAISKPHRLNRYIPKDIPKYSFPDHYNFKENEIREIFEKENATSILTTEKDFVKLSQFKFRFSIIKLEIKLSENLLQFNFG